MSSQKSSAKARRSAARLAIVQALYQLEQGDVSTPRQAIFDLMQMRQDDIEEELIAPDAALLEGVVSGIPRRIGDIDTLLQGAIGGSRPLDRSESVLRAILRAGAYELITNAETAAGIIINDYINVAHSFFSGTEPAKVNAVLDKIAKNIGRQDDSQS